MKLTPQSGRAFDELVGKRQMLKREGYHRYTRYCERVRQERARNSRAVKSLSDDEWLRRYDAHINNVGKFVGSYSAYTGIDGTLKMWRGKGKRCRNSPEAAALEVIQGWS